MIILLNMSVMRPTSHSCAGYEKCLNELFKSASQMQQNKIIESKTKLKTLKNNNLNQEKSVYITVPRDKMR